MNRLQQSQHDKTVHGGVKAKEMVFMERIMSGFAMTMKDVMMNNTEKKATTTDNKSKATTNLDR